MNPYVSALEASQLLGIDADIFRALVRLGRVPGAYKMGNAWVIPSAILRDPSVIDMDFSPRPSIRAIGDQESPEVESVFNSQDEAFMSLHRRMAAIEKELDKATSAIIEAARVASEVDMTVDFITGLAKTIQTLSADVDLCTRTTIDLDSSVTTLSREVSALRDRLLSSDLARQSIDKSVRAEVISRDGRLCRYCNAKLMPSKITIDHVTPVSFGGNNNIDNLVVACSPCNMKKGARTPDQAGMQLLAVPSSRDMVIMSAEEIWKIADDGSVMDDTEVSEALDAVLSRHRKGGQNGNGTAIQGA